jgi:predicted dehydrogenase
MPAMIDGCRRHGVKLMTAYRLHFERATLSALESVRAGSSAGRSPSSRPSP